MQYCNFWKVTHYFFGEYVVVADSFDEAVRKAKEEVKRQYDEMGEEGQRNCRFEDFTDCHLEKVNVKLIL